MYSTCNMVFDNFFLKKYILEFVYPTNTTVQMNFIYKGPRLSHPHNSKLNLIDSKFKIMKIKYYKSLLEIYAKKINDSLSITYFFYPSNGDILKVIP